MVKRTVDHTRVRSLDDLCYVCPIVLQRPDAKHCWTFVSLQSLLCFPLDDLDEVLKLRAEGIRVRVLTPDRLHSYPTIVCKRAQRPSRILLWCRLSSDLRNPDAAVDTQQ